MSVLLFLGISFMASIVGSICGIGGGVIIKPLLDLFKLESVSVISFFSSCTVLVMSAYSVSKGLIAKESKVRLKTATPLALGASAGGIVGQQLFQAVKSAFPNANRVGAVQSACLVVITLGTLLYTLWRRRIRTHHLESHLACVIIGLFLGVMSSFLGIGGGPINLVVLYYFFSMDAKSAAQNSLYVILFSQIANLIAAITTASVPAFKTADLAIMVVGGLLGGIVGRFLYKRMDNRAVELLFLALMTVIIGISAYNTLQYAGPIL